MKIFQVNCTYPIGSTGKIVKDIDSRLLEKGYESIICYGNGKKVVKENVYKISNFAYGKIMALFSRLNGYMYGNCFLSTRKLIKIIKYNKPDVVHLHCLNGHFVNIYNLITWLKENNINTVLTLHAEFMHTANCAYALECDKWKKGCGKCPRLRKETKSWFFDNTAKSWSKMKKAFENFNSIKIVSVSPWLMNRAKKSPIMNKCKHSVILNGVDTNIFKQYDNSLLKKELNISDQKIIFHVTSKFSSDKNHIKGGYYILELAERLLDDNVYIYVAGEYEENIKAPSNVIFLGKILDQEMLARYYSLADLYVMTSEKETFSMPVAESLCCGTPVVGFKAGAPEEIALSDFSSFVDYGDLDKLYEVVIKQLHNKKTPNISKKSIKYYSKNNMADNYIKLYENFYKNSGDINEK